MATLASLIVKITGDTLSLESALGRAEGKLSGFGDRASKAGGMLGSALKTGGLLAAGGIGVASAAMASFVKDAAAEQANIARLQTALGNLDAAHRGSAAGVELVIAAREQLAFADDNLRDSLSLLVVQTGDYEAALQRQALAMDVARGTGMDLQTASKLLGKINEETINTFVRYGVVLDKTATEQEALAEIQRRFAGQAAAYAETAAGKWEIFQIKLADIREDIGSALLPALTELGTELGDFLTKHESDIQNLADDFGSHIPKALDITRGALETSAEAAQGLAEGGRAAAAGMTELMGMSDDLAAAAVPLALAFAFLFPQGAMVAGILAVHETFTILDDDVATASDGALAFQEAWLSAVAAVLESLVDLEEGLLKVSTLGLSNIGFVRNLIGDTAAQKALKAIQDKRSSITGEQWASNPFGTGLTLQQTQAIQFDPDAFNAWIEAGKKADDQLTRDWIPSLNSAGGAATGASRAAQDAQRGLIDMALAFADFHAATGLGQQDFLALIQVSRDKADIDQRAMQAGIGLRAAQLETLDSTFQLRKGFVELAEDAVRAGRDMTAELAHVWSGIVGNIRSAFGGMFGPPTKEAAQLNLQMAIKEEELARRRAAGASSEETKGLEQSIERLRNRQAVLDRHADVLKAQIDVADQTLLTERERDFAAKLYTIAMRTQSTVLAHLSDQVSLEQLARGHLIEAMNGAARAYESAAAASNPFDAAEKHWINGIASSKGEAAPFPGFAVGTPFVPRDMVAVLHRGEAVIPAAQNDGAGGGVVNLTINASGEQSEASADRIARKVMRSLRDELGLRSMSGARLKLGGYMP